MMDLAQLKIDYAAYDVDPGRFDLFVKLLAEVEQLPAGDYVEIGVLWGLTLKVIHVLMRQDCMLYAFDTFDGFVQRDLDIEKVHRPSQTHNPGSSLTPDVDRNFFHTSTKRVDDFLGNPANLRIVQGWVPESLQPYLDLQWRFIHLDVDLYEPTIRSMELLWPKLVRGGVMLIHDYGVHAFAASDAVNEFCDANRLRFSVLSDYHHSALLRKE